MKHTADARRRAFARAFASHRDQTKAMVEAGYKPNSKTADELLKHPLVRQILQAEEAKLAEVLHMNAVAVVEDLVALNQVDVGDVFEDDGNGVPKLREWGKVPKAVKRAVQKVKVTVKTFRRVTRDGTEEVDTTTTTEVSMVDRLDILDKLGRHTGAFTADEKPPNVTNNVVVLVPDPCKTAEEWNASILPG